MLLLIAGLRLSDEVDSVWLFACVCERCLRVCVKETNEARIARIFVCTFCVCERLARRTDSEPNRTSVYGLTN